MSGPLEPPFAGLDTGGMAARILGAAGQIDEALAHLERTPWALAPRADLTLLAVGAMGGSAISADLASGLDYARLPRPVVVVRDYRWPAAVGSGALALVCSYSGNTEESLALYREAGDRGVLRAALTTGGELAAACARDGVPYMTLPGGSPPRAALYSAWVRVTALLGALGWRENPAPEWREAAAVLRELEARIGPGVPEAANPAKQLSRALQGRLPFIYSRTIGHAAVGLRWRQQINENAKALAHSACVPELNHNEIVGWEQPGAIHRAVAIVILRDDEATSAERVRLELTAEYAAAQGATVHEVRASGSSAIARAASLAWWGDWVSFYLAMLNGVDPTPIPSIDRFKSRLAAAARPGAR